jgi:hypothetical protein
MKKAFRIVPSIYFIFLATFWVAEFYMSLGIINYWAAGVIVLLLVQIFRNQKYIGALYGSIMLGFSIYKLVEAIVVYAETLNPTGGGFRFLIIKSVLFGMALIMAIAFLVHYISILKKQNTTTTSI